MSNGRSVVKINTGATKQPSTVKTPARKQKNAGGMLAKYRNPSLMEQEEHAWELAVQAKYAHR